MEIIYILYISQILYIINSIDYKFHFLYISLSTRQELYSTIKQFKDDGRKNQPRAISLYHTLVRMRSHVDFSIEFFYLATHSNQSVIKGYAVLEKSLI